MGSDSNPMRPVLPARFMLVAVFAATVLLASLTGAAGRPASAQNAAQYAALTPQAFLPLLVNQPAVQPRTATPSPTVTATPTGTPSPTLTPTATATDGPTASPDDYDQVHLAWVAEPSTTLTVIWRTKDTGTASTVQYREAGTSAWLALTGGPRPSGTAGQLHEVNLSGLKPGTAYEYRVLATGGLWSAAFALRTAPPARGPASFDAVFLADTGLAGRTDGLASGTQQIIDEIGKMSPLLLLGGGDYAYFDSDKRYVTLDETIDAWFNQMQPAASRAVLMPTYGNHETDPSLQENYESWAVRFPTPNGLNNRQNYSFDVGDVHFISLFAARDSDRYTDAQVAWLEDDITKAKARGMRWIIPISTW